MWKQKELLIGLILTLCAIEVKAQDNLEILKGTYLNLEGGISSTELKTEVHNTRGSFDINDSGNSKDNFLGIGIGKSFGSLRTELSYTNRQAQEFTTNSFQGITKHFWYETTLKSQTYALSGFYDFKNTSSFTPFIGAGFGYTRLKIDTYDYSKKYPLVTSGNQTEWNKTYLLMGGTSIKLNETIDMVIGYRYVNMGESNIALRHIKTNSDAGNINTKLKAHEYFLSLRIILK